MFVATFLIDPLNDVGPAGPGGPGGPGDFGGPGGNVPGQFMGAQPPGAATFGPVGAFGSPIGGFASGPTGGFGPDPYGGPMGGPGGFGELRETCRIDFHHSSDLYVLNTPYSVNSICLNSK